MSVLSNLEKELGLATFDLSSLQQVSMDIYDGVDFSIPSKPYTPASDRVIEETESIIQARTWDAPKTYTWNENVQFDPTEVAKSMGIPITNVTNLYLSVLDLYKTTKNLSVKNKAEEILRHLYKNNISREKCNVLINELNRLR